MKRVYLTVALSVLVSAAVADPTPTPTPTPASSPAVFSLNLIELNAVIAWQVQASKAKDEQDKAEALRKTVEPVLSRITAAESPPKDAPKPK